MRLWVISTSYPSHPQESTHAGVLARDLALFAARAGHDVTVVTPAKPGGVRLDHGLRLATLPWLFPAAAMSDLAPSRPRDLVRILSLFAAAPRALDAARRRSPPDGIVALWALPSGLFARRVARRQRCPYVVWMLGSDVWRAPALPRGVALLRRAVGDAAARFADGRELAERARALTGLACDYLPSIRRLPEPVPDPFPPADLLYVGRLHPNKGPDLLLEALARLADRRPELSLRMHGDGPLAAALAERASRTDLRGRVRLERPLAAAELAGALAAARLLVVPSRIESVPLILGDAAQAGAPVVASDAGDMAAVVAELGLGSTVPAGDAAALADGIDHALERPRGRPLARPDLADAPLARLLAALGPGFADARPGP